MNWSDVTIAKFRDIDNIMNSDLSQDEKNYELISVLLDIDDTKLDALSISEVKNKLSKLQFLNDTPKGKIPKYIWHKRKLYKVCLDLNTLSVAKYAELKEYTKVKEEINGKLNYILTTILSECNWFGVEKKRDVTKVHELAKVYDELPISKVYSISVFFCNLLISLNESTEIYLTQESQKKTTKILTSVKNLIGSHKDGVGSTFLIPSRKKLTKQ